MRDVCRDRLGREHQPLGDLPVGAGRPRRAGRPRIRVRSAGATARPAARARTRRSSRSAASTRVVAPAVAAMVADLVEERGRLAAAPGLGGGGREVEPGPGALPEPAPGPPRPARRLQRLAGRGYLAPREQDESPAVLDRGQRAGDGAGGQHRADPVGPALGGVNVAMRQVGPHAGEQVREQIGGVGDLGRGLEATLAQR